MSQKIASPARTREILAENGFTIKKGYGQNFLIDGNILERIIEAGDITKDDFVMEIGQSSGSDPVLSFHIKADDLSIGDRVFVSWKPDRRCTFRYLGNQQFIVEQAENSKLKVGNTFYANLFILDEPLYLSELVQGNNPPVVCGRQQGWVV